MRFSCDKCQAKYNIADEKVRGKVVAIKCTKCGNRITVNGKLLDPPPEEVEEATRMVSMDALNAALRAESESPPVPPAPARATNAPTVSEDWYVLIDGVQEGPLASADMSGKLAAGEVHASTFVWRDGMGDWKPAGEVAELKPGLVAIPEPPRAPAPLGDAMASTMVASKEVMAQLKAAAGVFDADVRQGPEPITVQTPTQAPEPQYSAQSGAMLDDLFDDHEPEPHTSPGRPVDLSANDDDAPDHANLDPFSQVPDSPSLSDPQEFGEQTRFFIAQSGVNKRNPPWKIGLFILLGIGLPAGLLFLLSQARIVPLEITKLDEETGEVVTTPIFSGEGLQSMRDKLLGKKPAALATKPRGPARPPKADDAEQPLMEKKKVETGMTRDEISAAAALYENDDRRQVGPEIRKTNVEKIAVDTGAGLDQKIIGETFGKNIKAFQTCNESEIRRNPAFKGGRINITFTIGPSGTVTRAAIDRPEVDKSQLGDCLKERARRVMFPSFQGESFDVEIPLVLSQGS